ncbi:protoporphyrinogen oxidase HemJ [Pelagibacteraceae bacterium]|nr:protoporphyrinogen oxidase HemJ [Pelagibacteraceae bacterium]
MNYYLLYKSLHLISVISWMAGLLYLPRIFVYHAESTKQKDQSKIFKIMERKLYFYIMNPAMILSWVFGVLLIHSVGTQALSSFWLQAKLLLVVALTLYHFFLFYCLNKFNFNENSYTSKFYRIINEVPTILLIIIIFVVVFKPL